MRQLRRLSLGKIYEWMKLYVELLEDSEFKWNAMRGSWTSMQYLRIQKPVRETWHPLKDSPATATAQMV